MFENEVSPQPERHPLISLILIFAVVFLGFFVVGPLIGFLFSLPFYPGSILEYAEAVQDIPSHPELKIPFYILQGFATFIGLIVAPALFLKAEQKSLATLFQGKQVQLLPVLLTIVIVIVFIALDSVFVQWNANVHLPEFLKWFEDWAREKEDAATEITKALTQLDSTFELIVAMFVIALLPAFGEEIVFRGLIQNELFRGIKNIHLAIWISAALFSAIHFQFFGFVPRMLLGALFGYLYYWSGNLNLAILAHFVNNGFSVVGMYLYQKGLLDMDVESTEAVPLPIVLSSAGLTAFLLYMFHQYHKRNANNDL